MLSRKMMRLAGLALGLAIVGTATWAGQAAARLSMNGSVVSMDVLTVKGRTYVPLADVAKALNMSVVHKDTGYELVPAGGSNEIAGLKGKLGDTLFTGKWRFTVTAVAQVDEYTEVYNAEKEVIKPKADDEVLVVVKCRIKNGTATTKSPYFWKDIREDTALTDDKEHGYGPLAYDTRNSEVTVDKMLPGSAKEFALIFSVPKGSVLKDLVYTISGPGDEGKTNVRIALKQP